MNVINQFLDNWKLYIIAFCVILFCIKEVVEIKDWFCDRFGIETKSSLKKKQSEETIKTLVNKINEIDALKNDVSGISEKVDNLASVISLMQENDNLNKRANLKDRISQIYRYYHERQTWNNMEKEAFIDLIRSYENAGGKNSFVHTICEPESHTWKLLD